MSSCYDVETYLDCIPPEGLINLGSALGLSFHKLQRLKHQDNLCYSIVSSWLREEGNVLERSGKPSWESLAAALERIGQNGIMRKILKERVSSDLQVVGCINNRI